MMRMGMPTVTVIASMFFLPPSPSPSTRDSTAFRLSNRQTLLAIEKESLERTEQALRAPGDVREPDEPVRQRLAGLAAL